jgi:hypothetical protein
MRAAQHFLGHRHRFHLMVSKKQGNFLEYCSIVPDIAALGEPPPQYDRFGVRRDDDGDSDLAGTLSIRSIEGDGADRIAAKARRCSVPCTRRQPTTATNPEGVRTAIALRVATRKSDLGFSSRVDRDSNRTSDAQRRPRQQPPRQRQLAAWSVSLHRLH